MSGEEHLISADSHVRLPIKLGDFFTQPKSESEQLREAYPWLRELEKTDGVDLPSLRQLFLTDGHTFLTVLRKFLNATKWQDFVLSMCRPEDRKSKVLLELLNIAFCADSSTFTRYQEQTLPVPKIEGIPEESGEPYSRLLQAINSRRSDLTSTNPSAELVASKTKVISELEETLKLDSRDLQSCLSIVDRQIRCVEWIFVVIMTSGGYYEEEVFQQFDSSPFFRRIAYNLRSLGSLVGSKIDQSQGRPQLAKIITALRKVVNNEGAVANIMLARIEEQSIKVQRQQQVITALQFRHLLEHLPRPLRDRKVQAAEGEAAKERVAQRWDQSKEVERWLDFWEEAVRQVYTVYLEHGTSTWTPALAVGHKIEPSPFAEPLKDYLDKAREKGDKAAAVRWLVHETSVGQHMKELYSTLSQIIHQFSDGKFIVDPLTFSPGDTRILAALKPRQSEEETVDFKQEFRRYVWEPVNINTTNTTQSEVKKETSDAEVFSRVQNVKEYIQAHSRLPTLFNQLLDLSATSKESLATVQASYKPAAIDIDSNGSLHSVVLAVLVDAFGRMAIAGSRTSEPHVTSKQTEMKFSSRERIETDDKIEISGKAKKAKGKHWNVDVEMGAYGDRPVGKKTIASGHFKAWEVGLVSEVK